MKLRIAGYARLPLFEFCGHFGVRQAALLCLWSLGEQVSVCPKKETVSASFAFKLLTTTYTDGFKDKGEQRIYSTHAFN